MSTFETEDRDTTGYFLPEDSQLRLARLRNHIGFLARLAQPRAADESREWAPEVRTGELAFCLEILGEQLQAVLDEVDWPAEFVGAGAAAPEVVVVVEGDGDAGEDAEAQEAASAYGASESEDAGFRFGVTPDQMESLAELLRVVSTHGDVMAVVEARALADGTLSQLAGEICEAAEGLGALLDRVRGQRIGSAAGGRVGEERAVYGVGPLWMAPSVRVGAHAQRWH
ncbi:XAC0095 family protein [Coralloluteibacterium stylophorae]|uniref:XAC0095-like domain-containing protein n=2 Tax=Coralloluteibacterium stylophorae TaxID=1776034 RepID=A0AAP2CAQ8_9GAMM|nr:hypothetical protein [Coralloluteibacterium stylophorae]MBS7457363.1 hypothetical protein [Coralloluteibacterium stylophorae]